MSAYLSLIGRRRGGRLFEVGRLLIFSPFRMGAYSKWALIRGWALVRINTGMCTVLLPPPHPGWVTPLYKLYRYVTPHRAGFLPILVWNQVWFSKELRGSDA